MKYTKKPQNLVAKNAPVTTTSSAGAHYQGKNQKKAAKHGETKHKQKEMAEDRHPNNPFYEIKSQGQRAAMAGKPNNNPYGDPDDSKEAYFWQEGYELGLQIRKQRQGTAEEFNPEYDDEAGMAHGSLYTLKRAVDGLMNTIDDNDNLPEWCQEKISLAEDYLVTVWDYLQSEKAQGDMYAESFDSALPYEQSLLQKLEEAVNSINKKAK